jgi:hypothetical protein
MFEQNEIDQLEKGFKTIRIVWIALILSLGIYVLIPKLFDPLVKPVTTVSPFSTLGLIYYGVPALVILGIFFIRRKMLNSAVSSSPAVIAQNPSPQRLHPAVTKYLPPLITALLLCEIIAVFGVVLFSRYRDTFVLYQFICISGYAMFYFRPRKEELFQFAAELNQTNENQDVSAKRTRPRKK